MTIPITIIAARIGSTTGTMDAIPFSASVAIVVKPVVNAVMMLLITLGSSIPYPFRTTLTLSTTYPISLKAKGKSTPAIKPTVPTVSASPNNETSINCPMSST